MAEYEKEEHLVYTVLMVWIHQIDKSVRYSI